MLHENLKNLRRAKGLSQESIAQRMYVTRQTVSKWENGLSVPDADALIRLSEILETPVSQLLGSVPETSQAEETVAQKREQLNLLLAERNARSRFLWKAFAYTIIGIVLVAIVFIVLSFTGFQNYSHTQASVQNTPPSALLSE